MRGRIGVDVGGVLTDSRANDGTDTSFLDGDFMKTTAVPGAYAAMRQLVQWFGPGNVSIISKCGPAIEEKTRLWLRGNGFYGQTGFDERNLHFCLERAGKAPIAQRLGLTGFVDDRADVLAHMEGIVPRRYLFGPQYRRPAKGLVRVKTWPAALLAIHQDHS